MRWEKKYDEERYSLNMAYLLLTTLALIAAGLVGYMFYLVGYMFYLEPLKMTGFVLGLLGFAGFSYILGRITF